MTDVYGNIFLLRSTQLPLQIIYTVGLAVSSDHRKYFPSVTRWQYAVLMCRKGLLHQKMTASEMLYSLCF